MAPPKDIARSYPKRGLTADVGFRSEPKFCGDGSVYFDGSSDYAETAASAALAVGDTFTLTAWVWLNPNPSGSSKYALRVGDTGAAIPHIASIGVFGGANPGFYCYNGSGSMSSSVTCDSARWYHVASVIKPGAGNSQLFVDGIDVTNSHSVIFNVTSSSSKIRIGDWNTGGNDWEGYLANACLFTESLTEDQVRQVMRASDYASHAAISTVEAFYPLSADFNDSTGNHNATLSGSVSFGVNRPQLPRGLDLARGAAMARVYTGRAVDFDGSSDFATATTYDGGGTETTMVYWFNADSTGGTTMPFANGGASNSRNQLQTLITSGVLRAADAPTNIPFSIDANRWYMLAIIGDSGGLKKAYLDGIDGGSPVSYGHSITATSLTLGARSTGPTQPFNGKLAGFKIFNVELTQAQIRELYHNPEQVLPTGVSASNLRRYYPLSDYNDTAGTGGRYFQDMGADGEPLEDIGSASMAFAQPVPCPQLGLQQSASRIYFDGVGGSSTGPRWDASISTAPGATWSLAYWIWYDSSLPSYSMILQGGGISNYIQTGGTIIWSDGSSCQFHGAFPSSKQDKWSHVVLTSTVSSPYVKCYVDGAEQTASGAGDGNGFDVTSFVVLARSTTTVGFHKGFCANMAIFDDALTPDEVTELFNQGIGYDLRNDTGDYASSADLLNYWLFDDLTSVVDRKGSNNLTNPTSTAFSEMASFPENASGSTIVGDFSMKRKGASILNISNDQGYAYALGQDKPSYFPKAGATGYTMSVAHRPIKTGITEVFWGNDAGTISTPTIDQFMLFMNPNGSYTWQLGDGSSRPSAISASGIADGEWHILTLTIDYSVSPARWTIYADGIQSTTATASISGPPGNFYDVSFGRWRSGGYKGSSASGCYRFYDVALSADEVKRLAFSDLRLIKGLNNE